MKDFLMKLFNKKEYLKKIVEQKHAIYAGAKFNYEKAVRLHRERKQLRREFEHATAEFMSAFNEWKNYGMG